MQFLALSVADLDILGLRQLRSISVSSGSPFSNCTETDVPARNFTAIEHGGMPARRDFLCTVNAYRKNV